MKSSGHIISGYPLVKSSDTLSVVESAGSKGLNGGTTCASGWAGYRVRYCSGTHLKCQPYGLLSEWARVEQSNAALEIQRPIKHWAFFFVVHNAKGNNLTLERLSQDVLDHWTPRHFINVSASKILCGFYSYPLSGLYLTRASRVLATSCSLCVTDIMSSI